jgi:hypothetical protein
MSCLGIARCHADLAKAKSSIPIPEVYFYNVDSTNEVGAPYILMNYVHGTVATELQEAKNCERELFGTPDQDRKFREQMASIQATISSFTFSQIGSLYQDEQTSDFVIGPEIETGKGPWVSAMGYYTDLASHAINVCEFSTAPEVRTGSSFFIPILFKELMSMYCDGGSISGPFRLANRDFGAHNLLVNDNFEIVGVIDLDGVMAAPSQVVAQYPVFTGLDREPPGYVETRPLALERIRETEPRLEEYKKLVEMAEAKITTNEGATPVSSMMLSDGASIFQGLRGYASHQRFVNDMWVEAYLTLLHKYLRSGE